MVGTLDTFTISRAIFLIFVICVSVYFIMDNKKPVTKEKFEKFENNTPDYTVKKNALQPAVSAKGPLPEPAAPPVLSDRTQVEKQINAIYQELYKTPPSKEELEFFSDYAMSRKIDAKKLRDIIETSAPTLQKTFYSRKFADTPDEIFGKENEIIEVFNELLMRNPDRRELYNFAKMMKEDATFTLDKLRQVLIASEEFKRMERTQNNRVYVNLQSNVTDRQLTMQITRLYADVTGKEYVDEDTMKFLKRKFVEFDLNETVMLDFIKAYIAKTPFSRPKEQAAAMSTEELEALKQKLKDELASEQANSAKQESPEQPQQPQQPQQKQSSQADTKEAFDPQGKTVIKDSKIINFFGTDGANSDVIKSLLSDSMTEGGKIDSQKLINRIRDNSTCEYNKNSAEVDMLEKNKQELADYINDRNKSHLKNICQRNKKFINADDNMVLFPEYKWSVPQQQPPVCMGGSANFNPSVSQTALIGTLLPDARDTQVGSILPVFPPV